MRLYRYVDGYSADHLTVELVTYDVTKETPKGYWFCHNSLLPKQYWKWVSKDSRKRHCYPTKQEAWDSYLIRKSRHVMILAQQHDHAKARLDAISEITNAPELPSVKLAEHGITLDI